LFFPCVLNIVSEEILPNESETRKSTGNGNTGSIVPYVASKNGKRGSDTGALDKHPFEGVFTLICSTFDFDFKGEKAEQSDRSNSRQPSMGIELYKQLERREALF